MSVYEYDLVETVVDQGADNIIVQVSESFGSDRNGTQPQSRRPHMMRAVADPGFRGIENLGFLGRPIGDFPGRDHVGAASDSNFNPRNTQCIPVVKIFAFLELE
jgi:hypothetical protein